MLNDNLLSEFAASFYGYGDHRADYWFIGMEEGGGDSLEEVQRRLEVWDRRGRHELEDLREFHRQIGVNRWFEERPALQTTWNKMIRIVLSAEGRSPTTDDLRQYQRDQLGRHGGNTVLVELLPLPSPSTDRWLYGERSQLPQLRSRKAYRDFYMERRSHALHEMVWHYQPSAVVFFSVDANYRASWERIAGLELVRQEEPDCYVAESDNTVFVATKHPATWGITNAYFESIGQLIREYRA